MVVTKHVEKMAGPANTSVYVILDERDGRSMAGKIIFAFGKAGENGINVYSALWDWSDKTKSSRDVQQAHYANYGCDHRAQAIKGFTFGAGEREFRISSNDMQSIAGEFQDHGYTLQWLL